MKLDGVHSRVPDREISSYMERTFKFPTNRGGGCEGGEGGGAGGRHPVEEEFAFAGILLVTNILQYKIEKQNLRRISKGDKNDTWLEVIVHLLDFFLLFAS